MTMVLTSNTNAVPGKRAAGTPSWVDFSTLSPGGFASGTVAAPSIYFSGSPALGFYLFGVNQIALSIGGVAGFSISNTENAGFDAADGANGIDVYLDCADGGLEDGTGANSGGDFIVNPGDGSAGTAAFAGGTGGRGYLNAGDGGASAFAKAGGVGGAARVQAGAGGNNTGGATGLAGGAGGGASIVSGSGGTSNSTGAHNGGAAGNVLVTAGSGGLTTAGTGDGGAGGSVILTPGSGGLSFAATRGKDGAVISRGVVLQKQGAQTAKTTSATLTAEEVLTGIITVNQGGAAPSAQQLPTATDMDTWLPDAIANDSFDFSVINISLVAAEDASLTTNAGWTLTGDMNIEANDSVRARSSGRFRARKTGAAAWTLYRLA